jgi:acetyltransferase-like isoleucine patch superfamily enzyme
MKTEKEKMLQCEIYDANNDVELLEERKSCKRLCFRYNQLNPDQEKEKKELLSQLLGKCTNNIIIEPSFWCDYGYNIEVGEEFYSNHHLVILDEAKVTFGDHVFIAPNCGFYTAGHPLDKEQRNQGLEYASPIKVGNSVWIGANVCVLPGVTIGDNSVIGAGSVVNKDIPANSLAVGNPCCVIKTIEKKQ